MKSVKILIIALTTIVFATSKSSFAFAKRIYMMLTSSNKHLQAVKHAEQTKKYLHLIFECDREERKETENEICLYKYQHDHRQHAPIVDAFYYESLK